MTYLTMTVHYLTGTGNSFRLACWMADQARSCGMDAAAVAGEAARPDEETAAGPRHLAGVVFPVHGFTAPWHVVRFALALPRSAGGHVFVAVARGATKFGRSRVIPGMEGTAGYLVAVILALKGYSVRGVTGIDMPSNWMSLHSALSPANVTAVMDKAKAQTRRLMTAVLSGGRYFNGVSCLAAGLALAPLSVLYLAVGRFWLAKLFFASNACTGCGLCVQNCPVGAVVMRGTRPRPYWKFSCESCMRCMAFCPERAVEAGHSFGAILYFVATIPVGAWLLNQAASFVPGAGWLQAGWAHAAVQYPYILAALWLSYRVFHFVSGTPLVNRLFTWTTLTHLYSRYHEPGSSAGDFRKWH